MSNAKITVKKTKSEVTVVAKFNSHNADGKNREKLRNSNIRGYLLSSGYDVEGCTQSCVVSNYEGPENSSGTWVFSLKEKPSKTKPATPTKPQVKNITSNKTTKSSNTKEG